MLLALQNAIANLLQTSLPALLTGAGAVEVAFAGDTWTFDSLSADPVAGEPGPADAVDTLAFDPQAPAGPYALTRPPYQGPKRVYLRSPEGELVPLSPGELLWNATDAASFTVQPRAGRELAGFNQLEVRYGVIAAGTQLKALHHASLTLTSSDAAKAEQAAALVLAVLTLNRESLREQGAFSFTSTAYQVRGALKTLAFAGGTTTSDAHTLQFSAEIDLRVERLLRDDEGKPIVQIRSPGRAASGRRIDVDPAVEA